MRVALRKRGGAPAPATRSGAQPEAVRILAALPDPVVVVECGGNIRFVNPAAEQFFGSGAVALCGTAFADLIRELGIDSGWPEQLGRMVEQHALRTLYEREVPRLPSGFWAAAS